MVTKAIKKKPKNVSKNQNDQDKEKKSETETTVVPKFIDPYNCFHLRGDIYFVDKLYHNHIGLMSLGNTFRAIAKMTYYEPYNLWETRFAAIDFKYDSWGMVYERLMSLGDSKAHDLAMVIQNQFLKFKDLKNNIHKTDEPNYILPIESSKHFENYCLEIDKMLTDKKDNYYFLLQFEVQTAQNGMVMKSRGFSKKMVDLIWGEETSFLELTLNNGLTDFLTIEKEMYFELVKNNILLIKGKTNQMKINFVTLEGVLTKISTSNTMKVCFDENGNVMGVTYLYEFVPDDEFLKRVWKARDLTTIISKKKSARVENLENILKVYYSSEDFIKKNNKEETRIEAERNFKLVLEQHSVPKKQCGFRPIDLK